MSKYFLFLNIVLSTSSFISGMENNIPQLKLKQTQSQAPAPRQVTPRRPGASVHLPTEKLATYPIFQAFLFIEAINASKLPLASIMINNSEILKGYAPAIIIKQALDGDINPNSPFYSQETWQNWDKNSPLNQKQFKATTLYLLKNKETASLEDARRTSRAYKHIQNLE